MSHIANAFRQLRNQWFIHHLKSYPHEREWESEEDGELREKMNVEHKGLFDQQTESIINGQLFTENALSPRCWNDLEDMIPINIPEYKRKQDELESALSLCLHVIEKGIEVRMQDQWPILEKPLREAKEKANKALGRKEHPNFYD